MKRYYPIVLFFLIILMPLTGKDTLRILSADGSEFSLVREGRRQDLKADSSELDKVVIGQGDFILTGVGTFLELISESGDLLLMVGENSSLSFDSLNSIQGSLITLSYGHIHGLLSNDYYGDLWVSGSDTVCRLSKGEFGFLLDYDLTLDQPEVLTRIYSLNGTLEVMQRLEHSQGDQNKRIEYKEPLLIDTGEMAITSSWERDLPLLSSLFDSDYSRYWRDHPFSQDRDFTPLIVVKPEETSEEITPEINEKVTLIVDENWITLTKTGTAAVIIGSLFMAGSTASYIMGQGDLGNGLAIFSGCNLLMGTGLLGYTYFNQPQAP